MNLTGKIVIYMNYFIILDIIKKFSFQLLSTSYINLKFIRVSKLFLGFNLEITYKLDK